MDKIIGITGSTGGLGRRLTEHLISKGFKLKALVRKTSNVDYLISLGVELIYGDMNDMDSLMDFIKNIDICYHVAAQVASTTKEQFFEINVQGTKNVCDSILKYNPSCRLIYCSSIVVKNVNFIRRFTLSHYTMSKYEAEKVVNKYIKSGLMATIIYPGYIYGPNDKNFMPSVIKMLQYGIKFLIKGGEKNVPVVYIDDLCELFYLAGVNEIAIGKKYVSLKENEIGIHEFLKIVAERMNYPFPDKVYPKIPFVIISFVLDKIYRVFRLKKQPKINMRIVGALSNRAKVFNHEAIKDLGWDHKVSVSDGINKTLAWYESNS